MSQLNTTLKNDAPDAGQPVVCNPDGRSRVVLVCEHATFYIPDDFQSLGLDETALHSHAAWDLGAMAVARGLSDRLDAPLVASGVSRLVYDCNRPPTAADAMPAKSEIYNVPGNANLTNAERQDRIAQFYEPFRACLANVVTSKAAPIIVTLHSFTPVYNGQARAVEVGILHAADHRLADTLLQTAASFTTRDVRRNAPYGPEHGVMHTLLEHAIPAGHPNVMLEIRNDQIASPEQQDATADTLARWLSAAIKDMQPVGGQTCPE